MEDGLTDWEKIKVRTSTMLRGGGVNPYRHHRRTM